MWYVSEVGRQYFYPPYTNNLRQDFTIKNTETNEEVGMYLHHILDLEMYRPTDILLWGTNEPYEPPSQVVGLLNLKDFIARTDNVFSDYFQTMDYILVAQGRADLMFLDYIDYIEVEYNSKNSYIRNAWNYNIITSSTDRDALVSMSNGEDSEWLSLFSCFRMLNTVADIPYDFNNPKFIGVDDANNVIIFHFKSTFTKALYSKLLLIANT